MSHHSSTWAILITSDPKTDTIGHKIGSAWECWSHLKHIFLDKETTHGSSGYGLWCNPHTVLCIMCTVRQVRDGPRYNPAQISGWAVVLGRGYVTWTALLKLSLIHARTHPLAAQWHNYQSSASQSRKTIDFLCLGVRFLYSVYCGCGVQSVSGSFGHRCCMYRPVLMMLMMWWRPVVVASSSLSWLFRCWVKVVSDVSSPLRSACCHWRWSWAASSQVAGLIWKDLRSCLQTSL